MAGAAGAQTPPTSPPAVIASFVVAGSPDPNGKVPTFNGVPGAGVANIDFATPTAILVHGGVYTYLVSMEDLSYTGTCKIIYYLTQGTGAQKVTLDSGIINKGFTCGPGGRWAWAINGRAVPNSPGPATLTGIVIFGSGRSAVIANLVIQ
jgi:hypothetical protein